MAETNRTERLAGIDVLRGLVMVLMALDHSRDYIGDFTANPTDLASASPALFLTRWVTHFCAPVFVFLAGTSAWLYSERAGRPAVSRFLATRGLWLIVLELMLIRIAWSQALTTNIWILQVIWAIGVSMVVLAGLVWLPFRWLLGFAFLIVAGHNLLDRWTATDFESLGSLWVVLHEQRAILMPFDPSQIVMVVYPVVPWVGVCALGYAFGAFLRVPGRRRARTAALGGLLCALFVVLRFTGAYGEPAPWERFDSSVLNTLSFLNCSKYPPSLLYLLMTLGPALLFLAWVDREPGPLARRVSTFGRVPLFFYVAHIALLSSFARAWHSHLAGEEHRVFTEGLQLLFRGQPQPEWYGESLPWVYAGWALAVLLLYPVCRWYAGIKQRGRSRLWSYL